MLLHGDDGASGFSLRWPRFLWAVRPADLCNEPVTGSLPGGQALKVLQESLSLPPLAMKLVGCVAPKALQFLALIFGAADFQGHQPILCLWPAGCIACQPGDDLLARDAELTTTPQRSAGSRYKCVFCDDSGACIRGDVQLDLRPPGRDASTMQDRAAAPQRSAVNCRVTDIDPGHNVSVCALERRRVVLKPVAYCCSLLIVLCPAASLVHPTPVPASPPAALLAQLHHAPATPPR